MTSTTTPPTAEQPAAHDLLGQLVAVSDQLTASLRAASAWQPPRQQARGHAAVTTTMTAQAVSDQRRALAQEARERARADLSALTADGDAALGAARAAHQQHALTADGDPAAVAAAWSTIKDAVLSGGSTEWVNRLWQLELQAIRQHAPAALRAGAAVGIEARARAELKIRDLGAAVERRALTLSGGEASAAKVRELEHTVQIAGQAAAFIASGAAHSAANVAGLGARLRAQQLAIVVGRDARTS